MKTLADVFETIASIIKEQRDEIDEGGFGPLYEMLTDRFFTKDCLNDSNSFILKNYKLTTVTPIDIEVTDSYFIFSHGSNSIVHFHIKECPGWLFAIWWRPGLSKAQEVDENYKPKADEVNFIEGEFFTQYEDEIDKFKPSRSSYCITIRYDLKDYEGKLLDEPEFSSYEHLSIIGFIHAHPELAFYRDYCGANFNTEYISERKAINYYKKYLEKKKIEEESKAAFHKEVLDYYKNVFYPALGITDYKIIDQGDCTSPRYETYVCIETTFEEDQIPDIKPWGCYSVTYRPTKEEAKTMDETDAREAAATKAYDKWKKDIEKRYQKTCYTWVHSILDEFITVVPKEEFFDPKTWEGTSGEDNN